MLTSVTNYFRERRDSIQRNAYVVGGAYLAWKHMAGRIKELRDVQLIQKFAEDGCVAYNQTIFMSKAQRVPSINRRFTRNESDINFTIMKLLPTLNEQILNGMNVEAITSELQEMVRRKKAAEEAATIEQEASPEPSISSTSPADTRSESGSVSVISSGQDDVTTTSELGASMSSWVDNMSTGQASQSHEPSTSTSAHDTQRNSSPESSNVGTDLSESFISTSSVSYGDVAVRLSSVGERLRLTPILSDYP